MLFSTVFFLYADLLRMKDPAHRNNYVRQINIHRLSRWFFRCGHSPARKAALYSANVVCASILLLFTRKRVLKLQFQLFCFFVFLQLVLNVFCYLLCILSYSVHIKSSAPE